MDRLHAQHMLQQQKQQQMQQMQQMGMHAQQPHVGGPPSQQQMGFPPRPGPPPQMGIPPPPPPQQQMGGNSAGTNMALLPAAMMEALAKAAGAGMGGGSSAAGNGMQQQQQQQMQMQKQQQMQQQQMQQQQMQILQQQQQKMQEQGMQQQQMQQQMHMQQQQQQPLPPPPPPQQQQPLQQQQMGSAAGNGGSGGATDPNANPAKLDSHPLIGEFSFFDGSFYLGFWREAVFRGPEDMNPLGATQAAAGQVQGQKASVTALARFRTPEQCRYGDRCRHKLSCSRFHGADPQYHAANCACEEDRCPLGHPLRAGRNRDGAVAVAGGGVGGGIGGAGVAMGGGRDGGRDDSMRANPTGKRPPATYVCAKCKVAADHYLNECPQNVCFRCGQRGHIATHCTNERLPDGIRQSLPELQQTATQHKRPAPPADADGSFGHGLQRTGSHDVHGGRASSLPQSMPPVGGPRSPASGGPGSFGFARAPGVQYGGPGAGTGTG